MNNEIKSRLLYRLRQRKLEGQGFNGKLFA